MDTFRIHGDNVVECERIAKVIIAETAPTSITYSLFSPSTIAINLSFSYQSNSYEWRLELLPGFNKAGRHRWQANIFKALKDNGSFLDETPDAIISRIDNQTETILCAIEFCSALQAGNQAWQRSGRAFSTGRTGCPYIYMVDFVKYELNSSTRERKALRFPNPAVPYSYISFSQETNNFIAQVYVRSEEFDKTREPKLRSFNEDNFAEKELSSYLVQKMCGLDTANIEKKIFKKNLGVVEYLAESSKPATNFTVQDWSALYNSGKDIVDYSIQNSTFNFRKKITAKGHHGKSANFQALVDGISKGLASKDLPFGIIPAANRQLFARGIQRLYPSFAQTIIAQIASTEKDLVLCMLKGFKPGGDDNRPDRGLLPLVSMLTAQDIEIMTYIYGPVIENNFNLLVTAPKRLANANGLWKSILALSDFVVLDVPILTRNNHDEELLLNTKELKEYYSGNQATTPRLLSSDLFSSAPLEYHEDDVDTGIHFMFSHLLSDCCFEGMCNPPGGDWSGFSITHSNIEKRWLSLPRVSGDIDGKRPDHILELFGVFNKPLLLSIESKERSVDLEPDVGSRLINYIRSLMKYIPNVERDLSTGENWHQASSMVNFNDYEAISAAAYLRSSAQTNNVVFANSNCDMLFIMEPINNGWDIEIVTQTTNTAILKDFLLRKIPSNTAAYILLH